MRPRFLAMVLLVATVQCSRQRPLATRADDMSVVKSWLSSVLVRHFTMLMERKPVEFRFIYWDEENRSWTEFDVGDGGRQFLLLVGVQPLDGGDVGVTLTDVPTDGGPLTQPMRATFLRIDDGGLMGPPNGIQPF